MKKLQFVMVVLTCMALISACGGTPPAPVVITSAPVVVTAPPVVVTSAPVVVTAAPERGSMPASERP